MFRVTFNFPQGWAIHVDVETAAEKNAVNIAKAKLYSAAPQLRPLFHQFDLPAPEVAKVARFN